MDLYNNELWTGNFRLVWIQSIKKHQESIGIDRGSQDMNKEMRRQLFEYVEREFKKGRGVYY